MIEIKKTQDIYTWHVEYHNGVIVREFEELDSQGRGFAEVNSSQVKAVALSSLSLPAQEVHRVEIPEGAEPVFFRRRATIAFQGDDTPDVSVKHCIGWRRGEQGVYLFVREGGSTLLTDNHQAI